ncbi:hypothetical protein O3M35_003019 [Rhynocoris fuscipes]|uniref:Glycoprotein endo-alpha-1,2-mannosidase n=1 Tax=Rhynocoris fuscipes TaxID=488301 RepID=A0AAW1CHN3_9HEMI
MQKKIERLSYKIQNQVERKVSYDIQTQPYHNVHIFYYSWFRKQPIDKKLKYWNHERKLSNTTKFIRDIVPVLTNYYPQIGFYSSRNASVVELHMKQIRSIGAGVILVAWYPPEIDDSPEDNLSLLMDTATKHDLQIALHIKSYSNRNPITLVYYIYDPQDISSTSWKEILAKNGKSSIRGTKYDGLFIALLADIEYRLELKLSYFDGFYTYFASNGMTYGATWKNWKTLSKFANENSLIFVPCVSPGYSDGFPDSFTRHRHHGNYYDVAWRSAISSNSPLIAITSFNAWNEGSQIEPAVPRFINGYRYLDYEPEQPDFYLNLTGWWIAKLKKEK